MSKYKYVWLCECSVGYCEFSDKFTADEGRNGKFCGAFMTLTRKRKEMTCNRNNDMQVHGTN